jgi:hypothetical protein
MKFEDLDVTPYQSPKPSAPEMVSIRIYFEVARSIKALGIGMIIGIKSLISAIVRLDSAMLLNRE